MHRLTRFGRRRFAVLLVALLALALWGCGESTEEENDDEITIDDASFEPDQEFNELSSSERNQICEWFRDGVQSRWNSCPNDPVPHECSFILPVAEECRISLRVDDFASCREGVDDLACAEPPSASDKCSALDICLNSEFFGSCDSDEIDAYPSFGEGRHCYTECNNHDNCRDDERCTALDADANETVCAPEDAVETD